MFIHRVVTMVAISGWQYGPLTENRSAGIVIQTDPVQILGGVGSAAS
jgi:hypothetical protein